MPKVNNFRQMPNFPELEKETLDFWETDKTFDKSIDNRKDSENFSFYDGPPFATGLPHYGHLMQSMIKDLIPRYQTMKGKKVRRVWGWDCHGLPIENIIEKELNLASKKDIEDYGVGKFNEACRQTVLTYAQDWKSTIKRIGRWIDMDNAYKTMDPSFMESVWWVFSELYNKGLIYKSHKPMHICPRCSTPLSNFEVTQGYQDVKDISVTAQFELLGADSISSIIQGEKAYLLAWTTTPWTLPGNTFLAVNADLDYSLIKIKDRAGLYILAKERISDLIEEQNYQELAVVKGQELAGLRYVPLFPYFATDAHKLFFTVQAADFVNLDDGTGIVHIAPAFGEDDYNLGEKLLHFSHLNPEEKQKLFIQHVAMDGKFISAVADFAGMEVKPKDNPQATDVEIIKYLAHHDKLFSKKKVEHSYPHCWRCDTPLLNYATDSWFVRVTDFKDQLLENNEQVNWQPEHIKHGRFGKWLEGARDWAISRNRFWGTPLPIWESDDGDFICVGSIKELEELCGEKVTDLHKHAIDKLTIEKDGKTYRHIPEVLDCWFESGSMPYGQLHYPFENKDLVEQTYPADFISEGQDQTRGWFYTLHILATALTMNGEKFEPSIKTGDSSAYKNIMCTGLIMAEDGKKMSKRLKNYPEPGAILDKYGADSLRLYLMSSPAVKAETLNFNEKDVANLRRRVFVIWWNVLSFYKSFGDEGAGFWDLDNDKEPKHVLDRWILSRLESLNQELQKHLDSFDVMRASRLLPPFVDDLSTWYLRLSRDRLKNEDNQEVSQVFATVIYTLAQLFAPIVPFFAELIHHNLVDETSSIHLTDYPQVKKAVIDKKLEAEMAEIKKIVELGHAKRKEVAVPLRQPLAKVFVSGDLNCQDNDYLLSLIKQELNVKSIECQSASDLEIDFDLELTPELKAEGEARKIIRQIQKLRKEARLSLDELVKVSLPSWPADFQSMIEERTKTVLLKGDKLSLCEKDS